MTYKIARAVLNEADSQRIMCCFFHMKPDGKASVLPFDPINFEIQILMPANPEFQIDYSEAAKDYGAASANSMSVMVSAALKKIRDAKAHQETAGEAPSPSVTPTNSRKRKVSSDSPDEGSPRKKAGAKCTGNKVDAIFN